MNYYLIRLKFKIEMEPANQKRFYNSLFSVKKESTFFHFISYQKYLNFISFYFLSKNSQLFFILFPAKNNFTIQFKNQLYFWQNERL